MPIIIADNDQRKTRSFLDPSRDYHYTYPLGLKLKPGSPLHDRIVDNIMTRALESNSIMSSRYNAWRGIDQCLTAYVRPESRRRKSSEDRKKKLPQDIVVPQMFAVLEILLTYATSALLEDTIFRYEGRSPEDIVGAILLEKVIDMQMYYTRAQLALHTAFRDAFAYGLGFIAPEWVRKTAIVTRVREEAPGLLDMLLGRTPAKKKEDVPELVFEGNRLNNLDPYLVLPDPNVPIDRIQDGEFFGWIDKTNFKAMLSNEQEDSDSFNAKYLQEVSGTAGVSRLFMTNASGRGDRTKVPENSYLTPISSSRIDVIKSYVDIIPRVWELPGGPNNRNGEYPECWYFEVAADAVVIKAKRLGLNHGEKPIAAMAPNYDGYSVSPVSNLEIIEGMQDVTNFLFNTHIYNVGKAINDILVIDPQSVDLNTVNDAGPGGRYLLRRSVWGRGLKDVIMQLPVSDVTKGHMADAQYIEQYTRDTSGAVDALRGIRRRTAERVTAQEVQGERSGAVSRLEKMAKVMSWMGMQKLGYFLASHTQQFMTQETYVKIVGQWQETLTQEYGLQVQGDRMKVSPFDLLVAYDVIARDGTIPGGNFSQVWVQMLPQLMQNQELMQRFDLVRVVKHIMRNAGAKDVDQFDRKLQPQQAPNAQVMPNEQVMQQVQQGNLVPVERGEQ